MSGFGEEDLGRPGDIRGEERSGEHQTEFVQSEVERLEQGERQRAARRLHDGGGTTSARLGEQRPRSSGDMQEEDGTTSTPQVSTAAGRGTLRDEMMSDLWRDENVDEYKDASEGPVDDAGTQSEPDVKTEPVPISGTPPNHDDRHAEPANDGTEQYWPTEEYGHEGYTEYQSSYDPGYYEGHVKEEQEEVPPRRPSGFIPLYTGTERRRTDRPSFGWELELAKAGYSGPGTVQKLMPETQLPPVKTEYGGQVRTVRLQAPPPKNMTSGPQQAIPTGTQGPGTRSSSTIPGGTSAPSAHTQRPVADGGTNRRRDSSGTIARAKDLSTLVSTALKVLPWLYSDTANVKKARDFWEVFEAHTAHFPDESRLLVFRQKLKGVVAERWWNNSTIKTFTMLKVRFHNLFLSRTADERWDRLHTTKRERGESVEEWGDRVTDLCDSLAYPDTQMRYQLFKRGLRNKRLLATLETGPARDIPEACEWLLVKEIVRPIEEDDEFLEEKDKEVSAVAGATVSVDALAQQMHSFVQQQQQQWQQQMMQNRWQSQRSPRNRMPNVSTVTPASTNGNVKDSSRTSNHFVGSGWLPTV